MLLLQSSSLADLDDRKLNKSLDLLLPVSVTPSDTTAHNANMPYEVILSNICYKKTNVVTKNSQVQNKLATVFETIPGLENQQI